MAAASAEILGAALSVLLPLAVGFLGTTALSGRGALSIPERLGMAYPFGSCLITACVFALGYASVPFTRFSFGVLGGGLIAILAGLTAWRQSAPHSVERERVPP